MNVVTMFDEQAKIRGEQAAIHHGNLTISFRQLSEQSRRGSTYLASLGFKPGDVVLVFIPMSIDLYCVLISLWRIGMTAMFLDPAADSKTMEICCGRAAPKGFIGIPAAHLIRLIKRPLRQIPVGITTGWFPLTNRWRSCSRFPLSDDIAPCNADTPALITFTSGSTGEPKGAARTHGFLAAQKSVLEQTLALEPGKSDLATLPIFTLINLACGVTTIIPSVSLKRPAEVNTGPILKAVARHRPMTAVAPPVFFERLIQDPDYGNLSSLKALFTGGAPVFPGLMKKLAHALPGTSIVAVYGSTEAEPISELEYGDIGQEDFSEMAAGAGLLAGNVVAQIKCRIIENCWGKPLGPLQEDEFRSMVKERGQPGEIVVHGKHVLKGYLGGAGDAENKFRVEGQVWHRTGDLGRFDEKGRLWLLGRCAAEIRDTRGVAYPFALETAARQYEEITKAAFMQIEGSRILVIETVAEIDTLKKKLQPLMARFHVDRLIKNRIPMDRRHNGKVDYPRLKKTLTYLE
jgi:acyl-CoA synthetase (AMP-forming)/AMP-acid ligase II